MVRLFNAQPNATSAYSVTCSCLAVAPVFSNDAQV